jgi:hypothetical protein
MYSINFKCLFVLKHFVRKLQNIHIAALNTKTMQKLFTIIICNKNGRREMWDIYFKKDDTFFFITN